MHPPRVPRGSPVSAKRPLGAPWQVLDNLWVDSEISQKTTSNIMKKCDFTIFQEILQKNGFSEKRTNVP